MMRTGLAGKPPRSAAWPATAARSRANPASQQRRERVMVSSELSWRGAGLMARGRWCKVSENSIRIETTRFITPEETNMARDSAAPASTVGHYGDLRGWIDHVERFGE